MKTGLFGQQLTLMEELKAATFPAHARLQSAPFFQALAACQLPLESYVGQLRALSVVHGALEQVLESCPDERIASVWNRDMRKLPRLLHDLRYFEPRAVADLKEAAEAALKTAERLRLRSMEQPLTLLGCLYVLVGFTIGAVVLRPLYARAFLLTGEEGLSYLHSNGPTVHVRWTQYQQRMNALALGAEEHEPMTQAANEFFAQIEAVFLALYPFQPESKTLLVTSINPEAGRHPVPADAREVKAALKAADDCWQRFAYFEHRYS
jgi:heme oxygenase